MTATASLLSSDPPEFATPAEKDSWLAEREAELAALLAAEAARITRKYAQAYADTLTAAGDPAALDGMGAEWTAFLKAEFPQAVEAMHLAGAKSQFLQAPGTISTSAAEEWIAVSNVAAAEYAAEATNRVVGLSDDLWGGGLGVRQKIRAAIRTGMSNEQLKERIEAVTGYSEFRADTIGRTETVGAFNNGDMAAARNLGEWGPVAKRWSATRDSRTRRSHRDADGQVRALDDPFDVGSTEMDHPHDRGAPPEEVVNCRCVLDFLYPGDPELEELGLAEPAAPPEPDRWVPPPLEGVTGKLTRSRDGRDLGGVHPKSIYRDEDGVEYLFKPMDGHLAHAEALASELGDRAGLSVTRVTVAELDGQVGSLQRLLPDSRPGFPGTPAGFDPTLINAADLAELQKQRVLDWMISNHDGHSSQFIRQGYASSGNGVIGIDKGQAFKYFGDDSIEWKWKPADRQHDPPTVYAAIEKAYTEGRITTKQFMRADAKNEVNATIRALEAIPDDEYRAMLRPYAEGRWGLWDNTGRLKPDAQDRIDQFLDAAVDRKNTMGKELANYHLRLYKLNLKARKALEPPKPTLGGVPGGPKGMVGEPTLDSHVFGQQYDHPLDRANARQVAPDLIDYTGMEYGPINSAARSGEVTAKMRRIDSQLEPTKKDMIVYRGTNLGDRLLPPGGHQALQGTVMQDRAYLSTFVDATKQPPGIASGNTGFRIMVPEGTKGRWVTGASNHPTEREFVLRRDPPLYVHSVRRSTGKGWESRYEWIVDVEVVDDEWARAHGVKVWDSNNGVYR